MYSGANELLNQLYSLETQMDFNISNPESAVIKLVPYRNKKVEHFIVICVDNRNNYIAQKVIAKGTVDQNAIFPQEVLRYALLKYASGIIVGHNHPGGDPEPSSQDLEITKRLKTACHQIGIRLLDHVIVSRGGHYSFQEHGGIL